MFSLEDWGVLVWHMFDSSLATDEYEMVIIHLVTQAIEQWGGGSFESSGMFNPPWYGTSCRHFILIPSPLAHWCRILHLEHHAFLWECLSPHRRLWRWHATAWPKCSYDVLTSSDARQNNKFEEAIGVCLKRRFIMFIRIYDLHKKEE